MLHAPIREGRGGSQKCAHTDSSSSYFIGGGAGGLGVGGESAVKRYKLAMLVEGILALAGKGEVQMGAKQKDQSSRLAWDRESCRQLDQLSKTLSQSFL